MIQNVFADMGGTGAVKVNGGKIARVKAEKEVGVARWNHSDEKINGNVERKTDRHHDQ